MQHNQFRAEAAAVASLSASMHSPAGSLNAGWYPPLFTGNMSPSVQGDYSSTVAWLIL